MDSFRKILLSAKYARTIRPSPAEAQPPGRRKHHLVCWGMNNQAQETSISHLHTFPPLPHNQTHTRHSTILVRLTIHIEVNSLGNVMGLQLCQFLCMFAIICLLEVPKMIPNSITVLAESWCNSF